MSENPKGASGGPVTGVRERTTVKITDTPYVSKMFNDLARTPWDVRTRLMLFADECRAHLEQCGLSTDPGSCEIKARAAGYDHPTIEWYCAQIVNLTWNVFRSAEAGDVWGAVDVSASVAMHSEQMRLRGYEALILRGQKVTAGGEKGAENRHGPKAERDERAGAMRVAFEDHVSRMGGGRVKEKALNETAKAFGVDPQTVRRALKKVS